ncbi:MAG TPA: type I restriction endonuclease, partial [Flavobacteriales bacterium]|nr:type I restriction endonuclease [Flavobacteriales bacterium]
MITEDQLEQLAISWFQDTGWGYVHGPAIAPDGPARAVAEADFGEVRPERTSYNEVVLKGRLLAALKRINPQLPPEALEAAAHTASTPVHTTLVRNNHQFQRHLIDGVPVEYSAKDKKVHDHARLIDFDDLGKNDFLVVNQFTIAGTKHPRRPDLILFVNGLPLGVIELKNPADENAEIWDAYTQLQTYKEQIEPLFVFNAALVVSDGFNARVGSITGTPEWFLPWRAIKHEDDNPALEFELEKVVRGFFDRELLLDYLRYFVLFENVDDRLIKKIAGYHQFHGVREAVRATVIASADTNLPSVVGEPRATYGKQVEAGSRKAGVFWHTQGSGKSISMVCYAGKLLQQREMQNPTLVVVTDRNDLDGQLFQQFSSAKDLLRQTPVQAD